MNPNADAAEHGRPLARLVVVAGVGAALHVGKLPPAVPALRESLGLSLVDAGFLLSTVQFAGMLLGLAVGLLADRIGLKRCVVGGLALLGLASCAGAAARGGGTLLLLRALEGMGLLLATAPAPALIRRLLAGRGLDGMLALWGAYMPVGVALALLGGPVLLAAIGWRGAWLLLGVLTLALAALVARRVPPERTAGSLGPAVGERVRRTLSSPGPWLLALSFAFYSGQWLAVIGFLPTVYAKAQLAAPTSAGLTALAALVNAIGNVLAGWLLQRGAAPQWLLRAGFAAMALGAFVTFTDVFDAGLAGRYAAVLLFSAAGGLVPGTLFALSVRMAPDTHTISATVGWVQQFSSFGQFSTAPLVAWFAARAGGWGMTWLVTAALSLAGLALTLAIAARLASTSPTR